MASAGGCAEAVAARSYASWDRDHPGPGWYDTCDSTACQVFRGVATYNSAGVVIARREYAASDAAVAATAGVVVTFSGQVAFTQFSASNGGWAVAGSLPYQRAFADPYDGVVPSTAHTWTATLQASTLESAYPVSAACGVCGCWAGTAMASGAAGSRTSFCRDRPAR